MNYPGPATPVLIVGPQCFSLPGRAVVVVDRDAPGGTRVIVPNPDGNAVERAAAVLLGKVAPAA